jgi:lysyl-tRNA synthetase class 2
MDTLDKRPLFRRRTQLARLVREGLEALGYEEVETPVLLRAPGMEPPIQAFRTEFVPELGDVRGRPLWLQTSPEFAMKRLLADGWERTFQLARVFRNGEVSPTHNPEFTMLEFYRAGCDYHALMDDLEALVKRLAAGMGHGDRVAWRGQALDLSQPFERISVRDAMLRETGLDIRILTDAEALRSEAISRGYSVPASATSWDDVFFAVFVVAVEPTLGFERPTFLIEYPARMAALARIKPGDPTVAERFELYAAGLELANGFSELNDAAEQRARFKAEQEERRATGREVYPIDDVFLNAVGRMPEAAGVAVGFDRLAMWLTGARRIDDVLLFPANDEWRA